jgi:hypothetical protein
MQEAIRKHGLIDGFFDSAWMTDWYLGDPTRVYYPPLTTWIMGPLSALTNDVFTAYRLFVTGILLTLGMSVYMVGVRWARNPWAAMIGGLLAVMAPYTLRTIFAEGNLPRGLAILTLPWIFWYTEQVLTERRTRRQLIILSLLWAASIVAHVMQGVMFAVIVGVYVLFRILNNVYIPLRRGLLALIPVIIGAGITMFYLIPAYSGVELANVPSLPGSKIDLFSIDFSALLPDHVSIEAISVGVITLAFALIVTLGLSKQHHKAFFLTGLIAIVLSFGNAIGVYRLIPLNSSLLPERFLNASAIIFPLIIATIPRYSVRWLWLIPGLALVLTIEFAPAWRVVQMRDAPPDELGIAQALAERPLSGRVAPLTFPNPTASQIFLTSEFGEHDNVSGWALENTPHQDAIRRLLAAIERSPEYIDRVLSLWNADYFVARAGAEPQAGAVNFSPVAEDDTLQLWERNQPTSFAQILPASNGMLIIGKNATSWLFSFPFASEGYSASPADFTPEYLSHFSVIGMNRLDTTGDVEAALQDWIESGNTLIVDLSGADEIFGQGYTLFGVQSFPVSLAEAPTIDWRGELTGMPDELTFAPEDTPWIGATYRELDAVVASLEYQGAEYPLLGYRDIGAGRVWYVGFNLLFWLDINGQYDAITTLTDYLLEDTSVRRSLQLPAFELTDLKREAVSIDFSYDYEQAVDVILSMTYFPRWHMTIDGVESELDNHEHLMLLHLPAGTHSVSLKYEPYSAISVISGLFAAGIGVAFIVAVFVFKPPLSVSDRLETFYERLPMSPPTETDYTTPEEFIVCPRCGYDHAEVGPPTQDSYPFVSISCPNCEYKL